MQAEPINEPNDDPKVTVPSDADLLEICVRRDLIPNSAYSQIMNAMQEVRDRTLRSLALDILAYNESSPTIIGDKYYVAKCEERKQLWERIIRAAEEARE